MDELYCSRLRQFRTDRKARSTQLEFSEDLSITPEHYSRIENGVKNPSVVVHIAICKILRKPSDCFFKENREAMVLSEERITYLESLDSRYLKTVLNVLRAYYVCPNNAKVHQEAVLRV